MKKIILIFALTFLIGFSGYSQCTEVHEDGSVLIFSPNYTDAVVERLDNGEWRQIGALSNNMFTDQNARANERSVTYRLQTDNVEFSTVYLTCTSAEDVVTITFKNFPHTNWIYIQRTIDPSRSPSKTIEINDHTSETITVYDTVSASCAIHYRAVAYNGPCGTGSNIATISKTDNQEPSSPLIMPICIDIPTQDFVISWSPSSSTDVFGYVVCKQDETNTRISIDTLYGAENTSYTCNVCSPLDTNFITVFAFDSCMNTSALSDTYNNVVLKYTRKDCSSPVHLSWNDYVSSPSNLPYAIFMMVDDESLRIVQDDITDFKYDLTLPQTNGSVKIYVTISPKVNMIGPVSNVVTINTVNADTLDYIYVTDASVGANNMTVDVTISLDKTKQVSGYELYRAMDSGEYTKVMDIPYNFSSDPFIKVTDNLPTSASDHIYTYYVAAPDICGSSYTYSNRLSTIRLMVVPENEKIKLSWNALANNTPSTPSWNTYGVFRFAENNRDGATLIGTTTSTTFSDYIDNITSATDRTYYYVCAMQQDMGETTNKFAISSSSYAKFASKFFIPNAFSPKDKSHVPIDDHHLSLDTFKPACSFVRAGSYSFKIYNRWGTLIFETNSPDEGWDGKYKGKFCPVGIYVYKVSYIDSEGMEQNHSGDFVFYD